MAFDVLQADGQDLRHLPLLDRREVLEGVLADQRVLFPARRLAPGGLEACAEVERRGYEGLVAKDQTTPYVGGRTLSWLKVKQPDYRAAACCLMLASFPALCAWRWRTCGARLSYSKASGWASGHGVSCYVRRRHQNEIDSAT